MKHLNNTTTKPLNQNRMKQTAVEWIIEKILKSNVEKALFQDEINQAKEMEKRQIILAHGIKDTGVNNMKCVTGEQYYNETFKSDEQE